VAFYIEVEEVEVAKSAYVGLLTIDARCEQWGLFGEIFTQYFEIVTLYLFVCAFVDEYVAVVFALPVLLEHRMAFKNYWIIYSHLYNALLIQKDYYYRFYYVI
jgi:hypothetical protein